MKQFVLSLALFLVAAASAFAQTSDLVVFSEQGERFWLILNGTKQNEKPLTNVRVKDLAAAGYKVKVIFEDEAAGSIDTYIALDLYPNQEVSLGARQVKKKVKTPKGQPQQYQTTYKLGMVSVRPLSEAAPQAAQQPPASQAAPVQEAGGSSTTQEQVTLQINGVPVAVPGVSVTTTTTQTTTPAVQPQPRPEKPAPEPKPAPARCSRPMAATDFANAKTSIGKQNFEESKLKTATQIINANCLSGQQLKELTSLFTFESNKLEFTKAALPASHNLTAAQVHDLLKVYSHESTKLEVAKAAYPHTRDKNNYYQLNDAFTHSSSKEELSTYILGQ